MQLSENKRRALLGAALLATVAASVWAQQQKEDLVELPISVRAHPRLSQPAQAKTDLEIPTLALEKLDHSNEEIDPEEIDSDLFDAQSWYVPPPPPPPVAKAQQPISPPAPVAPPLPFVYMGTLEDNGRMMIYLAKGDRPYSVAVGDTIEGTYRVEGVEKGQVIFTYLPMSFRQTLKIGS